MKNSGREFIMAALRAKQLLKNVSFGILVLSLSACSKNGPTAEEVEVRTASASLNNKPDARTLLTEDSLWDKLDKSVRDLMNKTEACRSSRINSPPAKLLKLDIEKLSITPDELYLRNLSETSCSQSELYAASYNLGIYDKFISENRLSITNVMSNKGRKITGQEVDKNPDGVSLAFNNLRDFIFDTLLIEKKISVERKYSDLHPNKRKYLENLVINRQFSAFVVIDETEN